MEAQAVLAMLCGGCALAAIAAGVIVVRWRAGEARKHETDKQTLGRLVYYTTRDLAKSQNRERSTRKRLESATRSKGRLYTEAIEDVRARELRYQHAIDRIRDIARHASAQDIDARVRAIEEEAQEALYGK